MPIKDGFGKRMSVCYKKEICFIGFTVMMLILFLLAGILFTNKVDELWSAYSSLNERVEYLEEVLENSNKFRAEADSYVRPLEIEWGM